MKITPEELEARAKRARETLEKFQPSRDLETLAKKIMHFEEFEKAALTMVKDLKAKGMLSPEEEGQLKDLIAERALQSRE
jgi:hypothetical protein